MVLGVFWITIGIQLIGSVDSSALSTSYIQPSEIASTPSSNYQYPTGSNFVRIRAWGGGWNMPGYDAQDVIAMIKVLKPDVLERFTSGGINPHEFVPVARGQKSMTIVQFLNASMQACAPEHCYIIPRLSLLDYDLGTLFSEAKGLLSLPIYPKITLLSLDDWSQFVKTHNASVIQSVFRELYAEGWKGIGVNDSGGYHSAYGYASWVSFGMQTQGKYAWDPAYSILKQIQSDPSIKRVLLYIDYPLQMMLFDKMAADREASILAYNVTKFQSVYHFTFVYPIYQQIWDSTQHLTSSHGHWEGDSIYQVELELMRKYNP